MKLRQPPIEDNLNLLSSQQPPIGSSSNFNQKLRWPNQNEKCLKWRRPQMEEDLKILNVECLSNHWSDLPQILNSISGDQTKTKNTWNKDYLKILKVEYLNNYWLDLPQILNWSKGDQTKTKIFEMKTTYDGRQPQNNISWISQKQLIELNFPLTLNLFLKF